MEYKGYNGSIVLDGNDVVITHHEMAAKASGLAVDTPRRISLQAVSGVSMKDASRVTNGWVTIGLGGREVPKLGAGSAGSDPQTVIFRHKDLDAFKALHDWLATVARMNQEAGIDPTAVEAAGQTRLERMKAKQQERDQKSDRRAEQAKASEESRIEASAEVVEPAPAAPRPAVHALPPQLPWWYRWSYKVSMAGYTFALVMYGVGCLLLLVFMLAVLAAILL